MLVRIIKQYNEFHNRRPSPVLIKPQALTSSGCGTSSSGTSSLLLLQVPSGVSSRTQSPQQRRLSAASSVSSAVESSVGSNRSRNRSTNRRTSGTLGIFTPATTLDIRFFGTLLVLLASQKFTAMDKLRWIFEIFDSDSDGHLTILELFAMLYSIQLLCPIISNDTGNMELDAQLGFALSERNAVTLLRGIFMEIFHPRVDIDDVLDSAFFNLETNNSNNNNKSAGGPERKVSGLFSEPVPPVSDRKEVIIRSSVNGDGSGGMGGACVFRQARISAIHLQRHMFRDVLAVTAAASVDDKSKGKEESKSVAPTPLSMAFDTSELMGERDRDVVHYILPFDTLQLALLANLNLIHNLFPKNYCLSAWLFEGLQERRIAADIWSSILSHRYDHIIEMKRMHRRKSKIERDLRHYCKHPEIHFLYNGLLSTGIIVASDDQDDVDNMPELETIDRTAVEGSISGSGISLDDSGMESVDDPEWNVFESAVIDTIGKASSKCLLPDEICRQLVCSKRLMQQQHRQPHLNAHSTPHAPSILHYSSRCGVLKLIEIGKRN